MNTDERICRLCFKMCGNFTTIVSDIKKAMDLLLLRIDTAAIQKPVICTPCAEILSKYFDFKTRCIKTHNYLIPFANKENGVKLILKGIYMTEKKNNDSVPEDHDICGLCMTLIEKCFAIFIDAEEKTLKDCLPELDLSIISEPVICAHCHASLEKYYLFMTTIFIAEEKLKYMKTLNINSKSEMELSSLLQFVIREKISGNRDDTIKLEKLHCSDSENAAEEVERKHCPSINIDDLKSNNEQVCTPKKLLDCETESNEIGAFKIKETFHEEEGIRFKQELCFEVKDKQICDEEIEIKTDELDCIRFEEGTMTQPKDIARLNEKRECALPNFENSQAVTIYKCYSCTYQTIRKYHLKKHLLEHKNLSEVKMHKCDSCLYQTPDKHYLKTHLLRHKDNLEVTMYTCEICLYETKFKKRLKEHALIHKEPSEVTMYKCDSCSFQTKNKYYLKTHLMTHKNPSEREVYTCDSCSYQTKSHYLFIRHLLKHKNHSEIEMYICDSCPYQSTSKDYLNVHLLKHKAPSNVPTYACDTCLYKTNFKHRFKAHALTHKTPSEVTMYKCDTCLFETKYKYHMQRHLLMHKNPSEIKMYECDSCSYQTVRKGYIRQYIKIT